MNFSLSLTCVTTWQASVPARCHREKKRSGEAAQALILNAGAPSLGTFQVSLDLGALSNPL